MALIDTYRTHRRWGAPTATRSIAALVAVWQSRRALARLDARLLEDIGVSRSAAREETRRSFWDTPVQWPEK